MPTPLEKSRDNLVTTLSAKADSFSDQSRVALEIRWPRPGQESASKDIPLGYGPMGSLHRFCSGWLNESGAAKMLG